MKEEIYKKIFEWLDNIANLASNEIPEFIREVATYGFYSSFFESIIWAILALFGIKISLFFYKKYRIETENDKDYQRPYLLLFFVAFSILSLVFLICFGGGVQDCIKAKICPKLYVIERFLK